MGTMSLHKKKMKKRKKSRSSDPELEERGDDGAASGQQTTEKEITSAQLDEAATEADRCAHKAKKTGKNKKKKHVSANNRIELLDEGGEGQPSKNNQVPSGWDNFSVMKESQLKKARKSKGKDDNFPKKGNKPIHVGEVETDEIYQISSEDEDDSRGMKKWLRRYYENRPGIEVLQRRIDDFVTAYWEREEQSRREREAKAAEDGWTVVVHKKGGKKIADPESGVVVGSVNQTAVLEKMAKKKSKEVALDFYRFQRREAQRNEVMKLQSKFEEDKKRIQQMRAARKFRPY